MFKKYIKNGKSRNKFFQMVRNKIFNSYTLKMHLFLLFLFL